MTINMSITIQTAKVTRSAMVVSIDGGGIVGSYSSSTILYIGLNFLLQKSSSEQHAISVGSKCGTKFPLHCIKPDSSGGRHPYVLEVINNGIKLSDTPY